MVVIAFASFTIFTLKEYRLVHYHVYFFKLEQNGILRISLRKIVNSIYKEEITHF